MSNKISEAYIGIVHRPVFYLETSTVLTDGVEKNNKKECDNTMKKNGFVFIETVVTVVILSTSLLLLYRSFSGSIQNEKERLYYDDTAYIYRASFVRRYLEENTNIDYLKRFAFGVAPNDSYIVVIGAGASSPEFEVFFDILNSGASKRTELSTIMNNFRINQMVMVKKEFVVDCYDGSDKCNKSLMLLNSRGMRNYLKSLNDVSFDYYLVFEFSEEIDDDGNTVKCFLDSKSKCNVNYTYLGI